MLIKFYLLALEMTVPSTTCCFSLCSSFKFVFPSSIHLVFLHLAHGKHLNIVRVKVFQYLSPFQDLSDIKDKAVFCFDFL